MGLLGMGNWARGSLFFHYRAIHFLLSRKYKHIIRSPFPLSYVRYDVAISTYGGGVSLMNR